MKKLLIFCIYFLLSFNCVFSQSWQWAKSGGGGDFDHGIAIAVDDSGFSYMTGNYASGSASFGSYNLPSYGWNEIFIAKYDQNGNVLWAKHAGGVNAVGNGEAGTGIAVDQFGNSYVTGQIFGTALFDTITLEAGTPGKFFLAKYDANGNCIWAKTTDGFNTQGNIAWSIALDKYENLYVTGSFFGTITFDSITITATTTDAFLVKYNTNGNCIWAQQINATKGAGGTFVTTNNAGDCYVTGTFRDTITYCNSTIVSPTPNIGNSFIAKYDSSGNCIWSNSISGARNASRSIGVDSLDNSYITGWFQDSIIYFDSFQLANLGGYDYFVAKYSPNGNCIWVEHGGGTGNDLSYSIATSSSGDNYIIGRAYNTHVINGCNFNGNNLFITEIDSAGNCGWGIETNALGLGNYYGVCIDKSKTNLYATGAFTNTATFGATTLVSIADNDAFIAKLNIPPTGVQENNNRTSFFNIYPNPSDGTYTMEIPNELLKSKMIIFDSMGKEVFQTILGKQATTINIPSLGQGIYFVKLQVRDGRSLQRSIVRQ